MTRHTAVDLAHRVQGSGPPLLILHGLFGSGTNWRAVARKLSDRFCTYTLDLRNHGDSPHAAEMNYPCMAADVSAFMRREGLATARIIGHSMGGKVAMLLALTQPELVHRLLVVDIAPVAYAHDHTEMVDAMLNVDLSRVQRRGDADALLADSITDPGLRAFLLQNLVAEERSYRWRINLPAIRTNMAALLGFPEQEHAGNFSAPVLFLRGGRSDYIQPRDHDRLHALFPDAGIETVAGAGHWVHAEAPDAFLAAAGGFLEG